jgi:cob(I)alamin adenosyltransferase
MKIYTKTGDSGKTSLVEGTRISKSDLRIEAYGTVDELNSFLGLLADHDVNKKRYKFLKQIQDTLFVIGANLASDPAKRAEKVPPVQTSDIVLLENSMDEMDGLLPELRHFVLPGGHVAVSLAHVARTVCRRAERCVVRLSEADEVPELVATYLNRLSDFFFVLSRMLCQELNVEEVKWVPGKD